MGGGMSAVILDMKPVVYLTREKFHELCLANPDHRMERTAQGELIIMMPTGGETGNYNFELGIDLGNWNRQTKAGKAFDSSTGFALPKGSDRSPDVSWISLEKWNALTPEQRKGFLPVCPDFVIELLSPTDRWQSGMEKMAEYMDNGCRLGWLIEPKTKRVAIYRPNQEPEILYAPPTLSGEDVLVGLSIDMGFIWEAV
jgi:Uma2 family endonuclease